MRTRRRAASPIVRTSLRQRFLRSIARNVSGVNRTRLYDRTTTTTATLMTTTPGTTSGAAAADELFRGNPRRRKAERAGKSGPHTSPPACLTVHLSVRESLNELSARRAADTTRRANEDIVIRFCGLRAASAISRLRDFATTRRSSWAKIKKAPSEHLLNRTVCVVP